MLVLRKFLNEIETLTDFKFLYNDIDIDYQKIVSVNASKERVSNVLENVFENTNIVFEVFDKQIVLKSKKIAPLKKVKIGLVSGEEVQEIKITRYYSR